MTTVYQVDANSPSKVTGKFAALSTFWLLTAPIALPIKNRKSKIKNSCSSVFIRVHPWLKKSPTRENA
jgi:hypothetical protein